MIIPSNDIVSSSRLEPRFVLFRPSTETGDDKVEDLYVADEGGLKMHFGSCAILVLDELKSKQKEKQSRLALNQDES